MKSLETKTMLSPIKPLGLILLIFLFAVLSGAREVPRAQDRLLELLTEELNREMTALQQQEAPPYFISYSVSDVHRTSVGASFGSLTNSSSSQSRLLSVNVRVGNYEFDNTHEIRGDPYSQFVFRSGGLVRIAQEDDPDAIRTALWRETNREYREAVERFNKVKANVAVKVREEDTSADFSLEPEPSTYYEPPVEVKALLGDRQKWEAKVKKYTEPFLENEEIYGGRASFSFTIERKNLVTSEGVKLAQNLVYSRLFVTGFIKSEDGMELPLYLSYFAFKPGDLPRDEEILSDVRAMIKKLEDLRDAPVVDPYTGPAILSGRAAGVFFHEIFGHRIEGHRQKSEEEGQTFKKKVGDLILPEHLRVVFDPTRKEFKGHEMVGHYRYDDEGVEARPVTVVESGVFESFLMSRSPIENFPRSNGHGRAQAGFRPVSRQSNLLVESSEPVPEQKLRLKLIEECKRQDKPFGLLFQDIQGGFTITGRTIPNAFNVLPTEVYRIYTDGRPDELVRGVDLVGTPLVILSMVSDSGDRFEIFNGMCGAESGSVPVSAVSPSLMLTQVEVQKKSKSQERPPILPRPDADRSM
jgi:predicted Zn-dependent protease